MNETQCSRSWILPLGMILAFAGAAAYSADPVVEYVRISQRADSKLVDIQYKVTDADGDQMTIAVSARDEVSGADIPVQTLTGSGANGAEITSGTHSLVWDAGADWPQQVTDQVTVTIVADDGTASPVSGEFVLIPGGSFQMGDSFGEGWSEELPVHTVQVDAFYMAKHELTNDSVRDAFNWAYAQGKITASTSTVRNVEGNQQELLDMDDSYVRLTWNGASFDLKTAKGAGYPCVEISWYGVVAYCNYRSQKEGLTPVYNLSDWSANWTANGYRLPTEAEWEYAARGGLSGKRFPWGDTIDHNKANYRANGSAYSYDVSPFSSYTLHPDYDDGGYPYTSPAGAFAANGYGLHDMAGNVWEWCWDWYDSGYYAVSPGNEARGPVAGSYRVSRGGSWDSNAIVCRVADRRGFTPSSADYDVGFRLARTVP